jgi:2,3-bisphosphoglycerate-independent phosphoglycerate mutase
MRPSVMMPASLPTASPRAILLVFLDGVGIAEDDPLTNPIAAAHLPTIRRLIGGNLVCDRMRGRLRADPAIARGIDATLDVPGLPQSGTGQTALLTGTNAPRIFGRHFGPWVPTGLRDLLVRENLFRRALSLGRSVAFANSYPRGYLDGEGRAARRPGAFPFAAASAGVLTRDQRALRAGDAIVSSIVTDRWRELVDPDAPLVRPAEAGDHLARISSAHDLTVFAHFDTDFVGHRGGLTDGVAVLERIDDFLDGLARGLADDTLLVITSDHGNLETVGTGHTRNQVPLVALGPAGVYLIERARRICDVAPVILELLESSGGNPLGERSG